MKYHNPKQKFEVQKIEECVSLKSMEERLTNFSDIDYAGKPFISEIEESCITEMFDLKSKEES